MVLSGLAMLKKRVIRQPQESGVSVVKSEREQEQSQSEVNS